LIKITQAKEFVKLKQILYDYCAENQLSEEKTKARIQAFENQFKKEDSIYFLATINAEAKGFMSCEFAKELIHTTALFVKKGEDFNDIVFELISYVSEQLESFKKNFLLIYFVNNLKLESKLKENDFIVYQRVKMVYNLKENQIPEYSLNSDYQLSYFTLDKLDEELQIVVDANKNNIDGDIFRQFSSLDTLKEFFFSRKMDSDKLRSDSPILLKKGKIVGVNIITNLSETASYVWIIALLSNHRGKGLGKYLMFKAHENCKSANVDQMILDVTVDNAAAFNLYKNLEYKETNRYLTVLKKYYDK